MQHMSSVGQMTAALAHQIRTPLHVIQSTVEFIEDQLPAESPYLEGMRVVDRNVERIKAVSDALAGFTKFKGHSFVVGDLNKVVEQVGFFMEMVCKKQGVRLNKSLAEIPSIRMDPDYLLGALYNLMANAVESMPNGGTLTLMTSRRENDVVLTIMDTGQGMDAAVLEQVGRPFFTTKPSGTGLGLFVVKKVFEQHKAKLQIESRKGVGTRMLVTFPGE
jgi:signal transduction histidine kinase